MLDTDTCIKAVLQHIYAVVRNRPFKDKSLRNTEIYQRFKQGQTIPALAQLYGLSESRIRWIIQQARRRE